MQRAVLRVVALLFGQTFMIASHGVAQPTYPTNRLSAFVHANSNLQLSFFSDGTFGAFATRDPENGDSIFGSEYPRSSGLSALGGTLVFGGIRFSDTTVSGHGWYELLPAEGESGSVKTRSTNVNSKYYAPDAIAEVDYQFDMQDTGIYKMPFLAGGIDQRLHLPLFLNIRHRSLSWGAPGIDDFILIRLEIANIGADQVKNLFVGWRFAVSIGLSNDPGPPSDRITSTTAFQFIESGLASCIPPDTLRMAYGFDLNGDPYWGPKGSAQAAFGIRVLERPYGAVRTNFNWYSGVAVPPDTIYPFNWGPRQKGNPDAPYRNIGPHPGIPYYDSNMYYVMSHREVDYPQWQAAQDKQSDGWIPPPPHAEDYTSGASSLFSVGPINLSPGTSVPLTIAIIAGDSVHRDPTAYDRLWNPEFPDQFIQQLDFSQLESNARYADWVYDNPGYDSDGDGYLGEFRICDGDTVWYKGDGIPDFRADIPPVAPLVRIDTEDGTLRVRWNGYKTESSKDIFTNEIDFEGYRVYVGRDARESAMSLVTSYDKENFNRFRFVTLANGEGRWDLTELPFTLDSLRLLLNDSMFDPLVYSRSNPLRVADSFFYFEKNDANNSSLTGVNTIRKAYPDITTPPPSDTNLWTDDMITTEHNGLRLPKYYEYEYVIDSLLPSVPWHVAITAFDFGFASGGLPPAESEIGSTLTTAFAQTSAQQVSEQKLEAYIYPNPYRIDAGYDVSGFENRDQYLPPDKARLIHFSNLPHRCTIHIYSLDGDRIITIEHDKAPTAPDAMHNSWDLITRNRQLITSGLYYFVVESPLRGTQLGKFVVIK